MIKKSQSIIEYTFIIGVVSLALAAMTGYGQKGIQAIIKLSSDKLGDQKKFTGAESTEYNRDEAYAEGLAGTTLDSRNEISRQSIDKREVSSGTGKEKSGSYIEGDLKRKFLGRRTLDKELE